MIIKNNIIDWCLGYYEDLNALVPSPVGHVPIVHKPINEGSVCFYNMSQKIRLVLIFLNGLLTLISFILIDMVTLV